MKYLFFIVMFLISNITKAQSLDLKELLKLHNENLIYLEDTLSNIGFNPQEQKHKEFQKADEYYYQFSQSPLSTFKSYKRIVYNNKVVISEYSTYDKNEFLKLNKDLPEEYFKFFKTIKTATGHIHIYEFGNLHLHVEIFNDKLGDVLYKISLINMLEANKLYVS